MVRIVSTVLATGNSDETSYLVKEGDEALLLIGPEEKVYYVFAMLFNRGIN